MVFNVFQYRVQSFFEVKVLTVSCHLFIYLSICPPLSSLSLSLSLSLSEEEWTVLSDRERQRQLKRNEIPDYGDDYDDYVHHRQRKLFGLTKHGIPPIEHQDPVDQPENPTKQKSSSAQRNPPEHLKNLPEHLKNVPKEDQNLDREGKSRLREFQSPIQNQPVFNKHPVTQQKPIRFKGGKHGRRQNQREGPLVVDRLVEEPIRERPRRNTVEEQHTPKDQRVAHSQNSSKDAQNQHTVQEKSPPSHSQNLPALRNLTDKLHGLQPVHQKTHEDQLDSRKRLNRVEEAPDRDGKEGQRGRRKRVVEAGGEQNRKKKERRKRVSFFYFHLYVFLIRLISSGSLLCPLSSPLGWIDTSKSSWGGRGRTQ